MPYAQLCYVFSANSSFATKVSEIIRQAASTLGLEIKIIKYCRPREAEKHLRRDLMQHIAFAVIDLANDADDRIYFRKLRELKKANLLHDVKIGPRSFSTICLGSRLINHQVDCKVVFISDLNEIGVINGKIPPRPLQNYLIDEIGATEVLFRDHVSLPLIRMLMAVGQK